MAYINWPRSNLTDATSSGERLGRQLDSWKEIASYLNRSDKTVRRWEKEEGLPVHRLLHEKRGSVYAYADELNAWLESRKSQEGEPNDASSPQSAQQVSTEASPVESESSKQQEMPGPSAKEPIPNGCLLRQSGHAGSRIGPVKRPTSREWGCAWIVANPEVGVIQITRSGLDPSP